MKPEQSREETEKSRQVVNHVLMKTIFGAIFIVAHFFAVVAPLYAQTPSRAASEPLEACIEVWT